MTNRGLGACFGLPILLLLTASNVWAASPQGAIPQGNPGDWVTTADYPTQALRNREQGTTGFRLTIDDGGQVVGCQVTSSSGSQELDTATCNLVTQRAHFSPAKDMKGHAVSGAYANRVRWLLPNSKVTTSPLGTAIQEFTFIVEPDGQIDDCKVLQNQTFGNLPPQDLCDGVSARSRGPVRDASGHPVRKRVTIKFIATGEVTKTTTISDP